MWVESQRGWDLSSSSKVIESVEQKLPTLLELNIYLQYIRDGRTISEEIIIKLGHSNCFELNCSFRSAARLIVNLTENRASIEHFKLNGGKLDTESIEAISQMKLIQVLKFFLCDGLTDDHIIDLTKELPQLQRASFLFRCLVIQSHQRKWIEENDSACEQT